MKKNTNVCTLANSNDEVAYAGLVAFMKNTDEISKNANGSVSAKELYVRYLETTKLAISRTRKSPLLMKKYIEHNI
jgi:hypothetical protein